MYTFPQTAAAVCQTTQAVNASEKMAKKKQ